MKKLNIGIIGAGGYWARNIIRDLSTLDNINIVTLCDINPKSLEQYEKDYRVITGAEYVLQDSKIDVVFIVTRISSHFSLAKEAILNKKHVFLEKPMTQTSKEAAELVKLAKDNNVILHVDHTFLYSNPVNYFKKQIELGILGDLYYIESTRTNYGPFVKDLNVLQDLFPHDCAILNYITRKLPNYISAIGTSNINVGVIDEARITLNYDNFNAYVNVSWLAPEKSRKITIAGKNGFLVNDSTLDDIIYYRDVINEKDVVINPIGFTTDKSPLKTELKHFIACVIVQQWSDFSSGSHGLEVMKMIEAANESISKEGIKIKL